MWSGGVQRLDSPPHWHLSAGSIPALLASPFRSDNRVVSRAGTEYRVLIQSAGRRRMFWWNRKCHGEICMGSLTGVALQDFPDDSTRRLYPRSLHAVLYGSFNSSERAEWDTTIDCQARKEQQSWIGGSLTCTCQLSETWISILHSGNELVETPRNGVQRWGLVGSRLGSRRWPEFIVTVTLFLL